MGVEVGPPDEEGSLVGEFNSSGEGVVNGVEPVDDEEVVDVVGPIDNKENMVGRSYDWEGFCCRRVSEVSRSETSFDPLDEATDVVEFIDDKEGSIIGKSC